MKKIQINKKLAEETGIHVGDGSMNIYNKSHCYTLACHHIDDKEYIDKYIVQLYNKIYNIKVKPKIWSQGSYGFRIHNKEIINFKHKILSLPLGKKTDIVIPKIIFENNKLSLAFIRGFYDTDGSINTFLQNKKTPYPRIEAVNKSKKLIDQVEIILKRNKFRTSRWLVRSNRTNNDQYYRIATYGFKMLKKWNKEIGFSNPKNIKKARIILNNE